MSPVKGERRSVEECGELVRSFFRLLFCFSLICTICKRHKVEGCGAEQKLMPGLRHGDLLAGKVSAVWLQDLDRDIAHPIRFDLVVHAGSFCMVSIS